MRTLLLLRQAVTGMHLTSLRDREKRRAGKSAGAHP
jgi:hypothetical protein